MSDDCLNWMTAFPALDSLTLKDCKIDVCALKTISRPTNVASVDLTNTGLDVVTISNYLSRSIEVAIGGQKISVEK